jgi:hypothetical protein
MVCIVAVGVFYARIIDNKENGDVTGGMRLNTMCVCAWCVAVCGQVG